MPWISVGGSLLGGLFGSDASDSAAQAQIDSAKVAEQGLQKRYDQTRADYEPFRQTGVAANSRLGYLLGINPNGGTGGTYTAPALPSREQIAAELQKSGNYGTEGYYAAGGSSEGAPDPQWVAGGIDQSRLDADVNARLSQLQQEQSTANTNATSAASSDPAYGSLLKKFSASDLEADPVYQSGLKFGLDTGVEGLNNRAIASGSYDSGAALKALTKYANDYGSTKANESYNRFNTDNTNTYNKLAGVSGAGQTATNSVTAAGTNAANNIAGLTTDAGSARSAGIVGGANAWGDAISGATNAYSQSERLKKLLAGSSSNGGFGTGSSYGNQDYGAYL